MVDSGLADVPWFARIGLVLDDAERSLIASVGRENRSAAAAEVVVVSSWNEAARILDAEDRDSQIWNAQEEERERLWDVAAESFTESELLGRLASVGESWADAVREAACLAAQRERIADPRFSAEAARAAQIALHHAELASLARAEPGHPFHRMLALFTRGRWPLGRGTTRFFVF